MKLKPIKDQVVVVMGATSGIGKETALRFAQKGARVVVSGRSQEALDALVEQIRSSGGEATGIAAEVSEYGQVKNVADRAVQIYGHLDTWAHLAAVDMWSAFEDTAPEEFKRIIDVNLTGQAYGAMAALPHLKSEGRGALIHVSSLESKRAVPYQSAYSASKRGMVGFLDALRMELVNEHISISVTNIIPASVNTPLFDKAMTKLGVKPEPIPPVYEPELVAEAILYAAHRPVRELYVGGAAQSVTIMQRISPRLGDAALRRLGQIQYSDIEKSSFAPHNLYKHLDGYDTIQGDYTVEAKSRSLGTWMQTHPLARWAAMAAFTAGMVILPAVAFRSRVRKMITLRNMLRLLAWRYL